jgi:hypothetical protein
MRSMILGLLLLTANVAHAETGDDVFTKGVGHNSCGQLIAAIGNTPLGKHEEAGTSRGVVVNEYAMYLQRLGGTFCWCFFTKPMCLSKAAMRRSEAAV